MKRVRCCIFFASLILVFLASAILHAEEAKSPDLLYYPTIGYPFLCPIPLVASEGSPYPSLAVPTDSVSQPIFIYRPSEKD